MQIVLILLEAITAAAGLAMKAVDSTAPVSKCQVYTLHICIEYIKLKLYYSYGTVPVLPSSNVNPH